MICSCLTGFHCYVTLVLIKKNMLYICLVCLSSFHVFHRIYLYMKLCIRNNSVQICQSLPSSSASKCHWLPFSVTLKQILTVARGRYVSQLLPLCTVSCGMKQLLVLSLENLFRSFCCVPTWFSVCGLVFMPRD